MQEMELTMETAKPESRLATQNNQAGTGTTDSLGASAPQLDLPDVS